MALECFNQGFGPKQNYKKFLMIKLSNHFEQILQTFLSLIIEISSWDDPSDFLFGLLEFEEVIIGKRLHNLTVLKSLASFIESEKSMLLM